MSPRPEVRHTPGPWHACVDEDGVWCVAPGADCGSRESFVAQIGTDEADARLIAQAPPMFEALRAIREANLSDGNQGHREALELVKAVLDKVEGGGS